MSKELLKTVNLFKAFHLGETIYAVNDVNITLEAGSLNVIVGPSGSGKSTLLSLLGGLDRPISGDIILDGQSYAALSEDELAMLRRRKLGYVFQFFNLIPHLTALENVMLPMQFIGMSHKAAKERATMLMEKVGLEKRLRHLPLQLSGGEQQRVAIARALANQPALVLADEPTGNLDTNNRDGIVALFKQLNEEDGQTFVMITHDPSMRQHAHQVFEMVDGRVTATNNS
jgi:putative ABC transport system ATP-binding protein